MRGFRPVYEFKHFRLDEDEQVLLCAGRSVPLTLKAFAVLVLLVENAGHLVLKDEFLRRIWPDANVEEGNLAQAISALRRALGESHQSHQNHEYIETVARRGYRFIAAVRRAHEITVWQPETKIQSSEYWLDQTVPEGDPQNPPDVDCLAKYSAGNGQPLLYLNGRYYWNRAADGLNRCLDYSWLDLTFNPDIALPCSGAAGSEVLPAIYLPPPKVLPKVIVGLTSPVQTNGALAEAHALLGLIRTFYDYDWPLAESDFKRAIELPAGSGLTQKNYGLALGMLSRFDEAIRQLGLALTLEARSSEMHVGLGIILYLARRFDFAMAQAQIALKLRPEFYPAQVLLGLAYLQQSRLAAAVSESRRRSLLANVAVAAIYPGNTHGVSGERRHELNILAELETGLSYVSHYALALTQAGLNHQEEALRLLQKTCKDPIEMLGFIKLAAEFDGLRSDQTFSALLSQKMMLR